MQRVRQRRGNRHQVWPPSVVPLTQTIDHSRYAEASLLARFECGSMLVVVRGAPRESLNLRVPPELKQQVDEYAEVKGVSINTAAILLLAEGLRVERRKR